ncbi:antigen-presenting glycoprotein CD1d2-like [Alligator mississippiensis]|uniref:antigen-presenting glycoprotein CD1d2-like n=1 Tax=Alligator mississippiensis TaxID=8496 RepID=UPI0028780E40|nr:antigen-presenting glycoprotein CD1d2-like [Alligator mississippiensis]
MAFPLPTPLSSLPPPTEPHTFRMLVTMHFHDTGTRTSDTQGTALLSDIPTHAMDCGTCPIHFHQPWAHQGLSPKQWGDLEQEIHLYLALISQRITVLVQEAGVGFTFVIQILLGCEILPNGTFHTFCQTARDRQDFVSYDLATGEWTVMPGDELAQRVYEYYSQDQGIASHLRFLLQDLCVSEAQSFAYYGKEVLKRQELLVAVVFAQQPPVAPELPLMLVCWVTGFYPQPIHVAWLQDGEEVPPGPGLSSSGLLPNADLTYQLRIVLAIDPSAGHHYACHVEHSSLGGHSLIMPWAWCRGLSRHWDVGLILGISISLLATAGLAAILLWRRHCESLSLP